MVEKTFLLDIRSRAPGKFAQMVNLVADMIVMGDSVRIHSPDHEFGEKFVKALEKELDKRNYSYG